MIGTIAFVICMLLLAFFAVLAFAGIGILVVGFVGVPLAVLVRIVRGPPR